MSTVKTTLTKSNGVTPVTCSSTVPAGSVDVCGTWVVANTYTLPIAVYASIQRSSVDYLVCPGGTLGVGNALFISGLLGKIGLEPGDLLRVWLGSAAQTADITVSVAREP